MRTTYHDSDGWPRPLRAPQHAAAPFGPPLLARLQAHRALSLFVTAGTWAAGLCLVTGAIAIVVSAASPGKVATTSEASSQHLTAGSLRNGRPLAAVSGRADPSASRPAPDHSRTAGQFRRIVRFTGHGDETTREFQIRSASRWQIQWAYTCPASLRTGLLVVEDADPGAVGASISEAGTAGSGATWLRASARDHRLVVISTCSWTLKVWQYQ
jgi:hypothetical protein